MKCVFLLLFFIGLNSCSSWFVNEKTSEIGDLDTGFLNKDVWNEIIENYSTVDIKDSIFRKKLKDFKNRPFETEVLYFDEDPKELIGISDDHYSVRYVFNPKLSTQILDRLSSKLSESEKKRITNRIPVLLIKHQRNKK